MLPELVVPPHVMFGSGFNEAFSFSLKVTDIPEHTMIKFTAQSSVWDASRKARGSSQD